MVSKYLLHHIVAEPLTTIDKRILPIRIPQILQITKYGKINIVKFLKLINKSSLKSLFIQIFTPYQCF